MPLPPSHTQVAGHVKTEEHSLVRVMHGATPLAKATHGACFSSARLDHSAAISCMMILRIAASEALGLPPFCTKRLQLSRYLSSARCSCADFHFLGNAFSLGLAAAYASQLLSDACCRCT